MASPINHFERQALSTEEWGPWSPQDIVVSKGAGRWRTIFSIGRGVFPRITGLFDGGVGFDRFVQKLVIQGIWFSLKLKVSR